MLLSNSTFEYQGQVLIEKFKIRTPFRYEGIFHNSGCFIYFRERGPRLLNNDGNAQVMGQEAVLLKCGTHFLDLLQESEEEEVEAVAVHLFPEILKELYTGELPAMVKKRTQAGSQIVASSEVIAEFVNSLEFYFKNPSLVNDDLLRLKIRELILLLIQSKNIDSVQELISSLYSPRQVQLREVIEVHLFSNLKLEELAKLCNRSLSSFKREFKKVYADSPTNYINTQRIEESKRLLKNTKLSISEIAYETGFQDPLYFARLFRKKTGESPSDFRA